ncbi:hypothetical protein SAMN05660657_01685 [Geodermatophilus amargosae]|uniref:Uncharacterized protein n=1 Tax=Geodermatophilus amargosae TaxID=1296565 RepID=A0A1I6Z4I4_9ACTN|nr:hypothetical protein SAMN05660657_01685 [Geodermatophilus amargosae]
MCVVTPGPAAVRIGTVPTDLVAAAPDVRDHATGGPVARPGPRDTPADPSQEEPG